MLYTLVIHLLMAILIMAQKEYCKFCQNHVACNSTGEFDQNCKNPTMILFKKCWVIRKHNEWRNKVAGGKVRNLKPACRMSYMQWDDELAMLAVHNVVQCRVHRDTCVKTGRFPRVVQNFGFINYNGSIPDIKESIEKILTQWYKEVENIRQSDIDMNRSNDSENAFKFTVMMEDYTARIGCAVSTFVDGIEQVFLLVCNYGTINEIGKAVYNTCNSPGEKCELHSIQYQNLCSRGQEFLSSFYKGNPFKMRLNIAISKFDNSTTHSSINAGAPIVGYNPNYFVPVVARPLTYKIYPALPPGYLTISTGARVLYPINGPYIPGYVRPPAFPIPFFEPSINNNNVNTVGSNNNNVDNASPGNRIFSALNSTITGTIDMSNNNNG